MNTKLTLWMEQELIVTAKAYSAKTGKSVSRIVADLFELIKNEKFNKEFQLTPVVKSLKGILKKDTVCEEDYQNYLVKNHIL
jgi:hypothetical protein